MRILLIVSLFSEVAGNSTSLEGRSSAGERAQCQCSVDGFSGGRDVFDTRWGDYYPSENIEHGGPYKFIGCGAHKYYRDRAYRRIAGYPWRFCYTYGGRAGCNIAKLSQKYSLNSNIAYRFCNGDYDCSPQAHAYVTNGTLLDSQVLEETDQDGYLQDWTNCCQHCRVSDGCTTWDFSAESINCRLFSSVAAVNTTAGVENAVPYWFYGTPGFDDAPVTCIRNQYETCLDYYGALFLVVVILGPFGIVIMMIGYYSSRGAIIGWTDDVTPGFVRMVTKTSSTKHGTRTYQVAQYSADLVCRVQGIVRRTHVTMEGSVIKRNTKFFFKVLPDGSVRPLGHGGVLNPNPNICGYMLVLIALIVLLVLSWQVYLTDGGHFQAGYVLPGSNKALWGAVAYISAIAIGSSFAGIVVWQWRHKKGLYTPSKNIFSREILVGWYNCSM